MSDHSWSKTGPRNLVSRKASKLTESLEKRLIKDAAGPLHESQVALKNGVSPRTLEYWLRRGLTHQDDPPYTSFALRYLKATIRGEEKAAEKIRNGDDEWRAALAWLERRFPKRWNSNLMELQNVREAFELADGQTRDQTVATTLARPSPELLRAIHAAGFELVKRNAEAQETPSNDTPDAGLTGAIGRDGTVPPPTVITTVGEDAGAPADPAQPAVAGETPSLVDLLRSVGE